MVWHRWQERALWFSNGREAIGIPLHLGSSSQVATVMLTQNGHPLGEEEAERWEVIKT
jgi:hypothetical protein